MAASAEAEEGRTAVRLVVVGVPAVESLFRASVAVVPAGRVAVLVAEEVVALGVVLIVVVRGDEVMVVAGFRAAVAVPVVPSVLVFPGLDTIELVLREVVDLFSSSLALTLGRLRWLDAEVEAVADRRTVVGGGRVGGLLKPPGARVLAVVPWAVLEATEDVTPGRRAVEAVVDPGRFAAVAAGLGVPFALEGVAGEAGVVS